MRDRSFAWATGTLVAAAIGCFAGAALFGGCEAQPCTNTSLDGDDPSPAIECPSGELCYRGECIRACSAGQERGQRCTADDECDDAARPRCLDGFCSSCEFGEQCIPVLNICQPVEQIELPEPAEPPTQVVRPPAPLDGGAPDGGLKRIVDAGMQGPLPEVEVTHAGFVDLAFEQDYRMGATPMDDVRARVVAFDVRGNGLGLRWRPDLSPPAIQCEDDDDDRDGCGERSIYTSGACEIRPLRTVTASTGVVPTGADLGDIQVDDHVDFPMSIRQTLSASFGQGQYVLTPPEAALGDDLLVFSEATFDQHYVSVTSAGNTDLTNGGWPVSPPSVFLGHHVPFRLEPSAATLTLLSTPTTVADPPTQDLFFQWTRINTGNDSFERVIVRILGGNNELFCDALEGRMGADTITLNAALLSEWRSREPAGLYEVYFERASAQRLSIDAQMGYLVDFNVRVRHTLIGEIEFQ